MYKVYSAHWVASSGMKKLFFLFGGFYFLKCIEYHKASAKNTLYTFRIGIVDIKFVSRIHTTCMELKKMISCSWGSCLKLTDKRYLFQPSKYTKCSMYT